MRSVLAVLLGVGSIATAQRPAIELRKARTNDTAQLEIWEMRLKR